MQYRIDAEEDGSYFVQLVREGAREYRTELALTHLGLTFRLQSTHPEALRTPALRQQVAAYPGAAVFQIVVRGEGGWDAVVGRTVFWTARQRGALEVGEQLVWSEARSPVDLLHRWLAGVRES